jgi:hypothetical protein
VVRRGTYPYVQASAFALLVQLSTECWGLRITLPRATLFVSGLAKASAAKPTAMWFGTSNLCQRRAVLLPIRSSDAKAASFRVGWDCGDGAVSRIRRRYPES